MKKKNKKGYKKHFTKLSNDEKELYKLFKAELKKEETELFDLFKKQFEQTENETFENVNEILYKSKTNKKTGKTKYVEHDKIFESGIFLEKNTQIFIKYKSKTSKKERYISHVITSNDKKTIEKKLKSLYNIIHGYAKNQIEFISIKYI